MERSVAQIALIDGFTDKMMSEITVETNGDFVCDDCNMILHNCERLISEVLWEFFDKANE